MRLDNRKEISISAEIIMHVSFENAKTVAGSI